MEKEYVETFEPIEFKDLSWPLRLGIITGWITLGYWAVVLIATLIYIIATT